MKQALLIHNPRCSKSRQALSILEEHGYKIEICDYLKGELTLDLLKSLKLPIETLLRTKEEEFQSLKLDLSDESEVFQAILKHPKILERPIVIIKGQAIVARPPENILSLI